MGHASITITLDRYGHLLPGNESEAADLLDALLASVAVAGRREDQREPVRLANVPMGPEKC